MKIDLTKVLVNLKGDNLENEDKQPLTLGYALANIIISSEVGGKMKLYAMAQKAFTSNELDIDAADLTLIKEAVKNTKIYTTLVAGQVELILEEVK